MEHDLKEIVKQFGAFIVKKLKITKPFKIELTDSREGIKTYAYYNPETGLIRVYKGSRSTGDILRSMGHELIHHLQNQRGELTNDPKNPIPDIGGKIEDEANAVAGQIVKEFGYSFKDKNGKSIYER
jgi:Zn-dependent peptidase ImmA (M78 family)